MAGTYTSGCLDDAESIRTIHRALELGVTHIGTAASWYLAALSQNAGRIRVGDKDYEVMFEPGGNETARAIDAAYEEKYNGSSAVPIMQGGGPKSATVRISPR